MEPEQLSLLIPILSVVLGLGLAGLSLYFRHSRNRMYHLERMAAIEKNVQLPENFFVEPETRRATYLLRGLIFMVVGIGLAAFFIAMWFMEKNDPETLAVAFIGLIPIGVGVSYLIVYRRTPEKPGTAVER